MANWIGTARSNYFHVKDEAQFTIWADACDLDYLQDKEGRYAIAARDGEGWPSSYLDEHGEDFDLDLPMELATHLKDGEVAILMEVGNEKLRYLTGYAVAVNSKGEIASVGLDEIYKKAATAFNNHDITRAEY
jgi:hypothetical protein